MVSASGVGPRPSDADGGGAPRVGEAAPGADEAARSVPNLLRSAVLERGMAKGRMGQGLAWVVRLQTVLGGLARGIRGLPSG